MYDKTEKDFCLLQCFGNINNNVCFESCIYVTSSSIYYYNDFETVFIMFVLKSLNVSYQSWMNYFENKYFVLFC